MAHSTKKLQKMIARQQQRIEQATLDLDRAVAAGDLEQADKLRNSLRSHRANVMRWQKTINRRGQQQGATAAIERSDKPAKRWQRHNHTAGEKRASQSDRKRSWRQKMAERDHDILRDGWGARRETTQKVSSPGLDWSGTSRA